LRNVQATLLYWRDTRTW